MEFIEKIPKENLEKLHLKLKRRYDELVNECVNHLIRGNKATAEVYAAEAAFVKRIDEKVLALLSKIQ